MLEKYFFEGNTIVHRLDPRVKVLLTLFITFSVAVSNSYMFIYFSLIYAVFILILSRTPIKIAFKRLLAPIVFLMILWIFLPFSMPGSVVLKIGPLSLTREGILYTYKITIKSLSILLLIVGFIATSNMVALFHALAHLRVPKKLVFLIFFTYRYVHVVWVEYRRIKNALAVRCFVPKTNFHTYKTIAYLLGMLLVRSYERSERVYKAMLCRGFNGVFYMLDHFHLRRTDIIFAAVSLIFFSGMLWISKMIIV